jgi:hypothetical protein
LALKDQSFEKQRMTKTTFTHESEVILCTMKILFVTTQWPGLTIHGGISQPSERLALELLRNGFEVEVLATRTERDLSNKVINSNNKKGLKIVQLNWSEETVSPWWLTAQYNVSKYIEDSDADVVISQEWQGLLSLYANYSLANKPVITWTHGGTLYEEIGNGRESDDKWKIFIDEHFPGIPSLLNINPTVLATYIKKYTKYYYY